jgi:hypothetical protein
MEAPQNIKLYFQVWNSYPLAQVYIGERRTTFAKAYGIKDEVLLGTLWEHVRNLGTLSFDPLVPWLV